MSISRVLTRIDPQKLQKHPTSLKIYGEKPDPGFDESIKARGVDEPIVVAADGKTIISGVRRRNAAIQAGLKEVPIYVRQDLSDSLDIEEAIIEANRHNEQSAEAKARAFARLREIESERAANRLKTSTGGSKPRPRANSPRAGNGRASDNAAEQVGMSRKTAEEAAVVVARIDEAAASGDTEKESELRTALNEQSVNAAYRNVLLDSLPRSAQVLIRDKPSIASKAAMKKLAAMEPTDAIEVTRSVRNEDFATFDDALKARSPASKGKSKAKPKKAKDATPKDKHGRVLPNNAMIETFADTRFAELEKTLKKALADMMKIRGGRATYLEVTSIRGHLQEAIEKVKNSKPFALCPECDGKGCKWCRNSGWMPAWVYEDYLMKKK